jgi:hypothetical protein
VFLDPDRCHATTLSLVVLAIMPALAVVGAGPKGAGWTARWSESSRSAGSISIYQLSAPRVAEECLSLRRQLLDAGPVWAEVGIGLLAGPLIQDGCQCWGVRTACGQVLL